MSLLTRLKKLVDPVQGHLEEYGHLDDTPPPPPPDATELPIEPPAPPDEVQAADPDDDDSRYQCKVCGLRSNDPGYCPECLADTMRPIRRRRGHPTLH